MDKRLIDEAWRKLRDPAQAEAGLLALEQLAAAYPADAAAQFECAGAFDFLGREAEAEPYYASVARLGVEELPEADRPRYHLQHGSTLRNLGRFSEAETILREGIARYPEHRALRVFSALNDFSRGRTDSAAKELFAALLETRETESVEEYRRAIAQYVAELGPAPARPGQLHHVELYVADLPKAAEFWGWFLEALGYELFQSWEKGRSWKLGETYLVFVQAEDRFLDQPFHRCRPGLNHLAFHARSIAQLEELARSLEARGARLLYRGRRSDGALFFEAPEPARLKVELSYGLYSSVKE